MSSSPRTTALMTTTLSRLFRPLEGKAWMATATCAACLTVGLTSYHLWHQYGDRVLAQPQYRLNADKLQVTPQPDWIRSDVKQSAMTAGRLHEANLLDLDLTLQVKQAFGVQPWVKEVRLVNVRYGAVEVDVSYRRPVAMVEVPPGMLPGYDYEGLLPVGEEGYLLPVEMTEEEAQQLPKIGGIDSSPAGPPGSPWGDPRVAEATKIILLLESLWNPLGLYKIDVPPREALVNGKLDGDFVLVTRKHRAFNWGSAVGQERTGEERAIDKVTGLKAWTEKVGSLDLAPLDEATDQQMTKVSELIDRRRRFQ